MFRTFLITLIFCSGMGAGLSVSAADTTQDLFPIENEAPILEKLKKADVYVSSFMKLRNTDQHFYVVDRPQREIKVLDTAFNLVNTFGSEGQGPDQFTYLLDMYATDQHVYVLVPGQIKVFTPTGRFEKTLTLPRQLRRIDCLAISEKTGKLILSRVGYDRQMFRLSLDSMEVLSSWAVPEVEGAAPETQELLQRGQLGIVGSTGLLLRDYLQNLLIFEKQQTPRSINLVPTGTPAANGLKHAMEYLANPRTQLGNPNPTMRVTCNQITVDEDEQIAWLLTNALLCRYDLNTGDTAYYVLYHPLSDARYPERFNTEIMCKNGHYWGGILRGMWIRDGQVIVYVKEETPHVYQLPEQN